MLICITEIKSIWKKPSDGMSKDIFETLRLTKKFGFAGMFLNPDTMRKIAKIEVEKCFCLEQHHQ
jgi:hypothetical protein